VFFDFLADYFWVEHSVTHTKNLSSRARVAPAPSKTRSRPAAYSTLARPPRKCGYPPHARLTRPAQDSNSYSFEYKSAKILEQYPETSAKYELRARNIWSTRKKY